MGTTLILKRFSTISKSYKLKRKAFNVIGDGVQGLGKVTNNVLGGAEKVAGDTANMAGKAMKSNVGAGALGLLAKGAIGAATGLGPLASTALGFIGSKVAGNVVKSGAEALQDSAAKRGFA